MSYKDPRYQTYKRQFRKPTPEEEAILKRWREEVEERVQARLRAYYGRWLPPARCVEQRSENQRAVTGAEQWIDCVFRVRHQPHDVSVFVRHGRDIGDGSVRGVVVTKQDLPTLLELRREVRRREPRAVVMLHRDHEPLPR